MLGDARYGSNGKDFEDGLRPRVSKKLLVRLRKQIKGGNARIAGRANQGGLAKRASVGSASPR